MQVFISHIDCLVTKLLDWTENLFVQEQTCERQDADVWCHISVNHQCPQRVSLEIKFSKNENDCEVREEVLVVSYIFKGTV